MTTQAHDFTAEGERRAEKDRRARHYCDQARIAQLDEALREAERLRIVLLGQLGYVPEPVLMYCNNVRAILAKTT